MESKPLTAADGMIPGLPREEVVEALHVLNRQGEVAQRKMAFYLLEFQRRELFRPGKKSAASWAERHLGLRIAGDLIRIAQRLEELLKLDRAFAQGEIPWTKVREISRVAIPEHEEEWIEFARTHNSREVEAAVVRARQGQRPGQGLHARRSRHTVRLKIDAEGEATWDAAIRKLREELGEGTTPSDVLVELSRRALREEPQSPSSKPTRRRRRDPSTTVVFHCSPERAETWVDTKRGPVEVPPEVVLEKIEGGAKVYHAPEVQGAGRCEAIRFGERGQVAPEDRDIQVSPKLKAAVLARDGHRCALCGSSRNLMPHHLDSWADGGESRAERLVSLCDHCHGGCHDGLLELWVEEDGRVTARGRDGEVIAAPRAPLQKDAPTSEGVLVERIEIPQETERPTSLGPTLRELPAELPAEAWRGLGGRIAWSASEHAFVLSEGEIPESSEADGPKPVPPPASRAASRRPRDFREVVAQRAVVHSLGMAARAARERGEVLGHVLLAGPSGLGKTTIARILASTQGVGFQEVVAGHIGDAHRLVELLVGLRKGDILFLDEIHRLRGSLEESLYTALEDGFVDVLVSDRAETRRIRIRLEAFTLVGATTRLGALSAPFRGRFQHIHRLVPYSDEQLAELVLRAGRKRRVVVEPPAALEIARRSRGTPREAIRILEQVRDWSQLLGSSSVKLSHVGQVCERLEIDRLGLQREDRQILQVLLDEGKPIGREVLATRAGLDLETLRDVHEPWLERMGLVERTKRGRVATEKARELYGGRARGRAVGPR